jgi:hypothetical protein
MTYRTVTVPDFAGGAYDLSVPGVIAGSDNEMWVVDEQGGWQVLARFDFAESAPRITHLMIHSAKGQQASDVATGGIMSATLRKHVSFTRLFGFLNQKDGSASWFARAMPGLDPLPKDSSVARFALSLHGLDPDRNFANVRRPGRRGRADLPYAIWAERYVNKAATTRRPYPALAAEYPDYDERRIRDIIQIARRRELIEGMSQGRAGGRLTPKAKDLLAQVEEEP